MVEYVGVWSLGFLFNRPSHVRKSRMGNGNKGAEMTSHSPAVEPECLSGNSLSGEEAQALLLSDRTFNALPHWGGCPG